MYTSMQRNKQLQNLHQCLKHQMPIKERVVPLKHAESLSLLPGNVAAWYKWNILSGS